VEADRRAGRQARRARPRRKRNSPAPPEDQRIFDPGHAAGRDGQELGDADAILEQRNPLRLAMREIDALAGRRPPPRFDMRDALAMNDVPQRQPIGAGGPGETRRERDEADERQARAGQRGHRSPLLSGPARARSQPSVATLSRRDGAPSSGNAATSE